MKLYFITLTPRVNKEYSFEGEKMSEKKIDNKTLVRKFLETYAEQYDLKIYHASLLRVIAEYSDMKYGYCCLSFSHLEQYSMMADRQRRRITADLTKYNIIEQTFSKGDPIHRIGETLTKNKDLILNISMDVHVTNHLPLLSHDGLIGRRVTN
jgi:hypothetical protein